MLAAAMAIGCGEHSVITAPPVPNVHSHPGFDTAIYPGDSAMRAWSLPGSPYEWVGYYLPAPCHRDPSWSGKRATLAAIGWGIAVLYVGQQTFDGVPLAEMRRDAATTATTALIPAPRPVARIVEAESPTCSRTLLSAAQGAAEAGDAVAKTAAEGFPPGTVIYLDVEHMNNIPASMDAYYRAWIGGILSDGRFRPGIYCHKYNAPPLHDAAGAAYAAAGRSGTAEFWVAGGTGFAIDKAPTGVGYDYAAAWQGLLEVSQSWGAVRITIDVDVARERSPSFPGAPR